MPARSRTHRARCALAVAAATLLPTPAATLASGPGVTVFSRQNAQPLTLSGSQIAAAADVRGRSYTLRPSAGAGATTRRLTGMSIRALLQRAGIGIGSVRFVSVVRANGSLATLTRAEIVNPPFAEGPALVTDEGATTRFLRPVRSARGTSDSVTSSSAGPLEITVNGGTLLAVGATASRRSTDPGRPVTFSARVRFPPAGVRLTYRWDFGDGSTAVGQRVTHAFSLVGDMQVQVAVQGTGGSSSAACSGVCGGVAAVHVRVGDPQPGAQAPGAASPGSGTGNPQAPGAGAGAGAGGVGGSGGGTTPGATGEAEVQGVLRALERQRQRQRRQRSARKRAAVRRRREAAWRRAAAERAQRRVSPAERTRPSSLVVTGVLLADQDAPVAGTLPPLGRQTPAGSPKGAQAARGAPDDPAPIPATVGLALLVVSMGALQERRRVRLRVA